MVVLAPVDGKTSSDPGLSVAYDLASTYDDQLVVIHVMSNDQFEQLKKEKRGRGGRTAVTAEEGGMPYTSPQGSDINRAQFNIEDAQSNAANLARRIVDETIDDSHHNIEIKGKVGDVRQKILAEAEHVDARFVVLCGRKRSPTQKAIFGSTSQSIILNCEKPVVNVLRE